MAPLKFVFGPGSGLFLLFKLVIGLKLVAALVVGLVAGSLSARASQDVSRTELFGYEAVRRGQAGPFGQLRGAIERFNRELDDAPRRCADAGCPLKRWMGFLETLRKTAPVAQLEAVNARINRARYVRDRVNYGKADYWATPLQLLAAGGDCEDYALAKYISLRVLGWPAEALRIVVLFDRARRLPHAVLTVEHRGGTYVLDNQFARPMPARAIRHYKPIYAVNERVWWLHRRPLQTARK